MILCFISELWDHLRNLEQLFRAIFNVCKNLFWKGKVVSVLPLHVISCVLFNRHQTVLGIALFSIDLCPSRIFHGQWKFCSFDLNIMFIKVSIWFIQFYEHLVHLNEHFVQLYEHFVMTVKVWIWFSLVQTSPIYFLHLFSTY